MQRSRKKPTEEKSVEEHKDPSLDHDLGTENLSCCQTAVSFVAAASSFGHFVSEISTSASTVHHRRRRKNRETEAKCIEGEVFHDPPPLVRHQYGKLIQSAVTSRISKERITVVLPRTKLEELFSTY